MLHSKTKCDTAGVDKISQASSAVADLQVNLQQELIIVEEKKAKTQVMFLNIFGAYRTFAEFELNF